MTAAGLRQMLAWAAATTLLVAAPVYAQGSGDAAGLQSGTSEGASAGPTVLVGAGTAAGVTTGDSGEAAAPSDGEEEGGDRPPPLPSDELCEAYADQPAHAACLATVLLGDDGGDQ